MLFLMVIAASVANTSQGNRGHVQNEIHLAYDYLRFAAAAPFSRRYRGRFRWHLDTKKWERMGIAASDIRRKVYIVPDTGAVFIAVSKAANTSLSFILSTKRGVRPDNVHRRPFSPERYVDTGKCLSDLAGGSTPIFTFVRHPVARFWSAYSDKVAHSRRKGRIRGAVATGAGKSPPEPLDPYDVITYLSNTPTIDIDEHFRPQWSCTGIEHLPIGYVGKVETIADDLKELVDRGFLTPEQAQRIPHLNAGIPREPAIKAEFDMVLREFYRKDMDLLGYK